MATKTTFTPEEWDLLMQGVMSSSVAVTAADPSGLWGLMKESFASARVCVFKIGHDGLDQCARLRIGLGFGHRPGVGRGRRSLKPLLHGCADAGASRRNPSKL
jgi:hypothetical protein